MVEYGSLEPSRGAINSLYLIPSLENDGMIPRVVMVSHVGSGVPAQAWHDRWLYLCDVPDTAVAGEIEPALRGIEADLAALADLYGGARWDGANLRGSWGDEHDEIERVRETVRDAVEAIPQYWEPHDWFAAITVADVVVTDADDLDVIVAREVELAALADPAAHLRPSDVRCWALNEAWYWLDRHDDPDDDDDSAAALRARLVRILHAQ